MHHAEEIHQKMAQFLVKRKVLSQRPCLAGVPREGGSDVDWNMGAKAANSIQSTISSRFDTYVEIEQVVCLLTELLLIPRSLRKQYEKLYRSV